MMNQESATRIVEAVQVILTEGREDKGWKFSAQKESSSWRVSVQNKTNGFSAVRLEDSKFFNRPSIKIFDTFYFLMREVDEQIIASPHFRFDKAMNRIGAPGGLMKGPVLDALYCLRDMIEEKK